MLGVPYTTECAPDDAAWAMSQAYGCCTQCAVFRRKGDGGAAVGAGVGGGEVAGWKDFDGFWWPSVRDEGYDRTVSDPATVRQTDRQTERKETYIASIYHCLSVCLSVCVFVCQSRIVSLVQQFAQ